MSPRRTRISIGLLLGTFLVAVAFSACFEPPPKIESIPPSGLALRLHVFGASAKEASDAFQAVKQSNKGFALVREGGDGEVLVGLENDSPKCVPPTALCSFKVALRIKNNAGKVVHTGVTEVSANADRCADLCEKAINNMVVKVVDTAVAALKGGPGDATDGGSTDGEAPGSAMSEAADAGEPVDAAPPVTKAASKKPATKDAKDKDKDKDKDKAGANAGKDSPLCSIAKGPQLKADEAERRAAQVDVLHRINVLSQEEYDCLRKAYLDRL